jgi:hypothetical protein
MRHDKPEKLEAWEMMMKEIYEQGPPRYCYNCIYYTREGRCEVFDMEPPKDFTQEANQCDQWFMEPPF